MYVLMLWLNKHLQFDWFITGIRNLHKLLITPLHQVIQYSSQYNIFQGWTQHTMSCKEGAWQSQSSVLGYPLLNFTHCLVHCLHNKVCQLAQHILYRKFIWREFFTPILRLQNPNRNLKLNEVRFSVEHTGERMYYKGLTHFINMYSGTVTTVMWFVTH